MAYQTQQYHTNQMLHEPQAWPGSSGSDAAPSRAVAVREGHGVGHLGISSYGSGRGQV